MPTLTQYRMFFHPITSGEEDNRMGLRSRLGGQPHWEQYDETPICSGCETPMTFVAQIDSIHHDAQENPLRISSLSGEQQYMFGDVGLIYVFFCFNCLETRSIFQCG